MKGLPLTLKTRQDFDNVHSLALSGKVSPEDSIIFFERLKQNMHYVFDRNLEESENPDGTEPNYIVIEAEDERQQYRLEANSAALINKIGYTESEITSKISELEALNG